MDWKDKFDIRAKQLANEAKERSIKEQEAKDRTAQLKYQQELAEKYKHLETFSCHVCGITSKKPKVNQRSYEVDYVGRYSYNETDWSSPGDLWRCGSCGKLSCEKHHHFPANICQTCAEKM